jgi:hypothetical protein
MYLGTCFGVKMSNIDNKNNIDSLNRLPNEGQKEFHEEKRIGTAIENQLNGNAFNCLQHALNFRNKTQEKYEFIRYAQRNLCAFYAAIKLYFVQFI